MEAMRKVITGLMLLLTGVAALAQQPDGRSRLLLVVDCSHSMWEQWQSAPKIKVTQQVLLSFLDSVAMRHDVEVALRVFGHQNAEQFGTRLEVPFGEDNLYRLRSKIKTLVPQGDCSAAAALADAAGDFPRVGAGRNIVLIITDGLADCGSEMCDVVRRMQGSGTAVQTLVLLLGDAPAEGAECVGKVYHVPEEEAFAGALHRLVRLSGRSATVVLRVAGGRGLATGAVYPAVWSDHLTGEVRCGSFVGSSLLRSADTLRLDPLGVYDLTVFAQPPVRREALQFRADSLNAVELVLDEGTLGVKHSGGHMPWPLPPVTVVVRQSAGGDWSATQAVGDRRRYLAGRYDVEVQTLPPTVMHGVEVRGGAATELKIPRPGMLQLSRPKDGAGGVIVCQREGRVVLAARLDAGATGERLLLQPGEYEVVIDPVGIAPDGRGVQRRFVIESGQTTKVQLP